MCRYPSSKHNEGEMWGKRSEAQQTSPVPQPHYAPASLDLPELERESCADAGADLPHVTKEAPKMTMDAQPAGAMSRADRQNRHDSFVQP